MISAEPRLLEYLTKAAARLEHASPHEILDWVFVNYSDVAMASTEPIVARRSRSMVVSPI